MKNIVSCYSLKVLESHLDTFGHVNNATYLELFEQARWDLLSEGGYGLQKIQEIKVGPVILELNLKFKKELTLREQIEIRTQRPIMKSSLIMNMKQEIYKVKEEQLAAELNLHFGLLDLRKRKMVTPSEGWMKAIGLS